jgi:hypothetical protein
MSEKRLKIFLDNRFIDRLKSSHLTGSRQNSGEGCYKNSILDESGLNNSLKTGGGFS